MEPVIGLFMQVQQRENGECDAIMFQPCDSEMPHFNNTGKNIEAVLHTIRLLIETGNPIILLGL